MFEQNVNAEKNVYLSPLTYPAVAMALENSGYSVHFTAPCPNLPSPVAAHPDMLMCSMAVGGGAVVFAQKGELSPVYPGDVGFNAMCLDKYFIHLLSATCPRLRDAAEAKGLRPVNVRQGYTKCSCVAVDGAAVITADPSIAAALEALGDVAVLNISPGFVTLPGYDSGFLGGASGRVGNEVWFNGDLSPHPDFAAIRDFIDSRGLRLRHFPGLPLTDVGSMISW